MVAAVTSLQPDPDAPAQRTLAVGEVRLRVCLFAVTANNVTCALYGDKLSFWHMFPVSGPTWPSVSKASISAGSYCRPATIFHNA